MASQPWWTFPRIDNFGTIDPAGPFWKPDSNVQIPGNYRIVALLPGTVTSVQNTGFGQHVVTIRLDNPVNSAATHTFYEHMSSATVMQGQHVNTGDLVGYNNPSGAVPLGFGFYSGDVYGTGPAWAQLQKDLSPGGAQLLNPVKLLNSVKGGGAIPSGGGGSDTSSGSPGMAWVDQLRGEGIKIGLFVLALVLVGFGFYMLFTKQANQLAKNTIDTAKKVAIAA